MKIAIVGCGAMGSVYAGLFASAGHEVWAIDRWREHVDAIKRNGLRLEGKSGDRTVKVNATTEAKDAGVCDLVILATKAMQVAPAAVSGPPRPFWMESTGVSLPSSAFADSAAAATCIALVARITRSQLPASFVSVVA